MCAPPVFSWMQKLHPACYVLSVKPKTALSLSGFDMTTPLLCQKLTLLCHCRELTWPLLCHCHLGVYTTRKVIISTRRISSLITSNYSCRSMSRGRRSPSPRRRGRSGSRSTSRRRSSSRSAAKLQISSHSVTITLQYYVFVSQSKFSAPGGGRWAGASLQALQEGALLMPARDLAPALEKSFVEPCVWKWWHWIYVARQNSIYLFIFCVL